ncbi:FAD-dependent monooxygenase [Planotetraspora kaengkrachanensis]|uniref:FAD-dependent oxidoreductase n=1 Tax=Planotetraspora kaengkrachanensis TaxID=575193 RepID=A0A8J3VBH4_9ACTN|nr:FAD-dependent monooxygenase [Planotetraspora kaengkrachanensis]GIG83609.1 FAD-dependent oxidoreductase [Planotetraspora kaengkrachanensis]
MEVIVTGGGVAGAASAIALRRIGAEVTVYEAYSDPAGEVGSFLSLASNGLRGLEALGCLEEVQRLGFAVPTQRMIASSGRVLGEMARGRMPDAPLLSVALMRGRLVETLREQAIHAGARIVTGRRLVGAAPAGDGVGAEFSDGSGASADLLVGADGLWSATRSILNPETARPGYAGMYSVSGVSEGVPGMAGRPPVFNMVYARNGAFIYIPAPDGTVWWSAQIIAPRQPDTSGVGDAEWLAHLAELYRFERTPLAIIEATAQLHRPTLMHVLAEVPTWHDDRVVLVGDAAHPVGAGQGASMAIEDAVVLAQALARNASTAAALAEFDRLRRARIGRMAKIASANREAKKAGPLGRRLSDLFMPVAFRLFYTRATSWLYTHDLGTLPEVTRGAAR